MSGGGLRPHGPPTRAEEPGLTPVAPSAPGPGAQTASSCVLERAVPPHSHSLFKNPSVPFNHSPICDPGAAVGLSVLGFWKLEWARVSPVTGGGSREEEVSLSSGSSGIVSPLPQEGQGAVLL